MHKKHFGYLTAGSVALVFIMMLGFGVLTVHGESPFSTDKSDRTLLKEIHVNQQKTISLLNEIKGQIKALEKK